MVAVDSKIATVFDGSIPSPIPRTVGTEEHESARAVVDDLIRTTA